MVLWCTVIALAIASGAEVRFDGRRWPLLEPPASAPSSGAPAPFVLPGTARLDTGPGVWSLSTTHRVVVPDPGGSSYLVVDVADRSATLARVTLDGQDVPVKLIDDRWVAAMALERDATLRVDSFLPERSTSLRMPAGAAITLLGPGFVEGAPREGDTFWVSGPTATLRPSAPSRAAGGSVVVGEAAVGLTVRDDVVAARARLRFRVARGEVDTVAFRISPAPPDLEVRSDQVASVERQGSTSVLRLARPERGLVDLEATWTSELPAGSDARIAVALPTLRDTFRDTLAVQVAPDTDREVVPLMPGFDRVVGSGLPDWARGLVDEAPSASFVGSRAPSATLELLRTSLVDQPPTVIEVAESTLATSAEGRVLLQTRLAVRNDGSAFLTVAPPDGLSLVSARVKGKTALVTRLDDGRYLVPLARSVQSVQGSLSFPVELAYLGTTDPWPSRGPVTVPLPAYDAPVAVHRTNLHLPPGYRAARRQPRSIVGSFTEGSGINYGYRTGDARVGVADALLERAVAAWLDNEFETSRQYVDQLGAMGADNADVGRLRSNLAVVLDDASGPSGEGEEGGGSGGESSAKAASRRLKALARARAERDLIAQRDRIDEAEEYLAQGEYEQAQRSYQSALDIGDRLARIAAEEDVSQQVQNDDLRQRLADIPQGPEGAGGGEGPSMGGPRPDVDRGGAEARPAAPPPPPLTVTATTASVVVPTLGEVVRHQRLLVAANDAQPVTVRVACTHRTCKRNPRRIR